MGDAAPAPGQRANAFVVTDKPKQLDTCAECWLIWTCSILDLQPILIQVIELVCHYVQDRLEVIGLLGTRDDAAEPHGRQLHA